MDKYNAIRNFTNVLDTFDFIESYNLYFEKVNKKIVTYSSVKEPIQSNHNWIGISLDIQTKHFKQLNYKLSVSSEDMLACKFEQICKLIEKGMSLREEEILNLNDSNFNDSNDYCVKFSNMFEVYTEYIRNAMSIEPEVIMEVELIEREYANVTSNKNIEITCNNIIALSGMAKLECDGKQYYGAKRCRLVSNIDQLNIDEILRLAKKTIIQLNANINSVEVEPGIYPIVFASGEGSYLVHEIIGHMLEADNAIKIPNVQVGSRLSDINLNIFDINILEFDKRQLHKIESDLITRSKLLVDNGILKNLIDEGGAYDSYYRSSYIQDAIPRMRCIYIQNGIYSPEEVIASVDDGYYVVDFVYGNLNPITLDFRLKSSEAYRIRNGKIVEPVYDLILEGNALRALKNITLIANDLDFYPIKCAKKGQVIWTEAGQPTLRINEISVY